MSYTFHVLFIIKQFHIIPTILLVSDLRQVGGFLRFPPPIKLTATI